MGVTQYQATLPKPPGHWAGPGWGPLLHKHYAGEASSNQKHMARPAQCPHVPASRPRAAHPQSRARAGFTRPSCPHWPVCTRTCPPGSVPPRPPAQCACLLSSEAHASTPGLVHGRWARQAVGQGCSQVSGPSTPVAWVSGLSRVPVSIQSWRWQHTAGGQALGLLSLWRTAKGADPTACLRSSGLDIQALVTPCC